MSASLADVFRSFAAGWLATHAVSAPQARVMRAVLDCRTAALGGHCEACDACGHPRFVYHSGTVPPASPAPRKPGPGNA